MDFGGFLEREINQKCRILRVWIIYTQGLGLVARQGSSLRIFWVHLEGFGGFSGEVFGMILAFS